MSMFGGFGRPQPSSAEKIAAAEAEMDLVTDMFNKYFPLLSLAPISLLE
jgi:import inner membrane translocase subunit TIM10